MEKIIKFPNKKEELKKKAMKDLAKYLIDNTDGDFCVIFKGEDMQHLFDDDIERKYLTASTNIDKFEGLELNNKNTSWFELNR